MLAGHFAAAFSAKRVAPSLSLGTLVFAALFADLLVFVLAAAGIEHFHFLAGVSTNCFIGDHLIYSHSLLMDVLWGALLAAGYFLWRRQVRAACILFLVVVSHWVLDVISHRPDMPLGPGIPGVLGLGLWNSIPATLIVEGGLWLAAIILYARATHATGPVGIYAFWAGVAVITLAWISNITVGPSTGGSGITATLPSLVFFGLMIAWAYWAGGARAIREGA